MHILDTVLKSLRNEAHKIEKQNQLNTSREGMEEAKNLDEKQKSAIMQIADTEGFKIIIQQQKDIIDACNTLMSSKEIPDAELRITQITYSIALENYLFLTTLADPNSK